MVFQHILSLAVILAFLSSSIAQPRSWPKDSGPSDGSASSSTISSSPTGKDEETVVIITPPDVESNSFEFPHLPLHTWMSLDKFEDNALTFDCVQGARCKLNFTTSSFSAINNSMRVLSKHRSHNWMINGSDQTIVGVPLTPGLFEYTLIFSDEKEEDQRLPFAVNVTAIPSTSQNIIMWFDKPSVEEFKKSPSLILQLVEDFASALKVSTSQISVTHMIQLGNLTQVTFQEVNASECDPHRFNVITTKLVTSDHKIRNEFLKDMNRYHEIHKVEVLVPRKCHMQLAPHFTTTPKAVAPGTPNISTTTTANPSFNETMEMFLSLGIACGLVLIVGVCWFGWRVSNQAVVHSKEDIELGLVDNIVEETDHDEEGAPDADLQDNVNQSGDEGSSSA